MLTELRDEIEEHCMACSKLSTDVCRECFFASVDFGRLDLGSHRVYKRAYHYLRSVRASEFIRTESFGGRLNIPERRVKV